LIKTKNTLSDEFNSKLFEITAGYFSVNEFSEIIKKFNSIFLRVHKSTECESNLLRIISSLYDKILFLKDSLHYPHYLEIIITAASYSNYLTDILVRNPEYIYLLLDFQQLNKNLGSSFEREIDNSISKYNSFESKIAALKSIKRKETLKIACKDLLGFSELTETTNQLSILAKALIKSAFELCYEHTLKRYKIKNVKSIFCLIALGKLGGNELNYSSDVDLICFYDKESKIQNKTFYEILSEAIQLFIEKSSQADENGYLYRIDFRLRPDGKYSPLCKTIYDYLSYYETKGESWERQMLIKASFLYGDEKLFAQFTGYLNPFIYPSAFKHSPLEQIKYLRQATTYRLVDNNNIKLSKGGIRDIEFSVQALQLLNGYKYKSLRTGNTIKAIDELLKLNLISIEEKNILCSSYAFYRRIEHFLQLMNDAQTHTIPRDRSIQRTLGLFLGFNSEKNLLKFVDFSKKKVLKIFNSITGLKSGKDSFSLQKIKFKDASGAINNYLYLKEGKGLIGQREFDIQSINAFVKIEETFFAYLKRSKNPDLVLQNFVRIIRNSTLPSVWYDEFIDKKFFISFLKLCENSQKAIDLFAEDKPLRELFLSRKVFERLIIDKDYLLDTKSILFICVVQFALQISNCQSVQHYMARIIKKKINIAANSFVKSMKEKYFIAAMGSLANNQLSFASDIDLIFIAKNNEPTNEPEQKFILLLKELKSLLHPLKVDCRLRPEGKSSQILWSIKDYKYYLLSRARIWELQALCKIDFICGNKNLFDEFIDVVKLRISKEEPITIAKEIKSMRDKINSQERSSTVFNIKKSIGGLNDIEFLTQFLILCNVNLYSSYIGKNFNYTIRLLYIKKLITKRDLIALQNNFSFLKKLLMTLQSTTNNFFPILQVNWVKNLQIPGFPASIDLKNEIEKIITSNSNIFNKYLNTK